MPDTANVPPLVAAIFILPGLLMGAAAFIQARHAASQARGAHDEVRTSNGMRMGEFVERQAKLLTVLTELLVTASDTNLSEIAARSEAMAESIGKIDDLDAYTHSRWHDLDNALMRQEMRLELLLRHHGIAPTRDDSGA